ncbi:MAG: DUF2934 domain-containing protein [Dissulfuribacterales bacterium]
MPVKKFRIVKGEWSTFLKDFNRQNQCRRFDLMEGDNLNASGAVFLGIVYEPNANKIEIYAGESNPAEPGRLVHSVESPRAVYLVKDDDLQDPLVGLNIQGPSGNPMVSLQFHAVSVQEVMTNWTTGIAYSIYLSRDMQEGDELRDWFEAERIIKNTLERFID